MVEFKRETTELNWYYIVNSPYKHTTKSPTQVKGQTNHQIYNHSQEEISSDINTKN